MTLETYMSLGMMSGTSMDGIDLAALRTDGERLLDFGPTFSLAYTAGQRHLLRQAVTDAQGMTQRDERPGCLAQAEQLITALHAEAVKRFRAQHPGVTLDVIGFHGQTLLHRPLQRLTVQIGDAGMLAKQTDVPVVYDLRVDDVLAGGQGAPLVPVYHRALVTHAARVLPVAVVNIGGVSNITLVLENGLYAFDSGPGNALIDDWMVQHAGLPYDEDGRCAAQGVVDEACLNTLLADPYFAVPPPKSLDRDHFAALATRCCAGLSTADGAATLATFTAHTLAAALQPHRVNEVIVAGGGARNPTLMRFLSEAAGTPVMTADACGWQGQFIEAQAFAFLAVRSLLKLPLTFPGTTGVAQAMSGGKLTKAD